MTNEEKAKEIGQKWYNDGANEVAYRFALQMAKWKEEQMIEKAVEWLRENANNYIYEDYVEGGFKETKLDIDDLTETFKKAMEE